MKIEKGFGFISKKHEFPADKFRLEASSEDLWWKRVIVEMKGHYGEYKLMKDGTVYNQNLFSEIVSGNYCKKVSIPPFGKIPTKPKQK